MKNVFLPQGLKMLFTNILFTRLNQKYHLIWFVSMFQTEQTFLADADGCHKNGFNGIAAAAGENGNGGGYR